MRKDSIENKILSGYYPTKEQFIEYYINQNHSQNNTAKYFNITKANVQSLVEFWGLKKTEEQISSINSSTRKAGKGSVEYKLKTGEYPSYEDFYSYYVTFCHSRKDTASHFNITETVVTTLSQYWNIHKSKAEVSNTRQKTCLDKYGCVSNLQDEDTKQKIKNTCLEKYGVEYATQSEVARNKRRQTFLNKYGVKYVLQNDDVKQKLLNTVRDKYGVDWPCQLEECQRSSHGKNSKPNQKFEDKLTSLGIEFSREYSVENYMFDFKIGDVLIEIDPWFTHQSSVDTRFKKKDKDYHHSKSVIASEHGYHCVHVFDWDDEDKIINIFLKKKETCYARQCEIKVVDEAEEVEFLNKYHLQGYIKSDICIGLYFKSKLVQLMSFGKPRYNANYSYELLRLCSCNTVVGGSNKIFKYFLDTYNPDSIISYCDLSKFNGTVYNNLGFELLRTAVSKHWYSPKLHRHITDNLLRQRGFDQLLGKTFGAFGSGVSNKDLMLSHGFVEIYDAGQATYVFTNK